MLPTARLNVRRVLLAGRATWSWQRVTTVSAILLALSVLGLVAFIITRQITITGVVDLSGKRFNDIEGGLWARLSTVPYYAYRMAGLARFAFYLNLVGMLIGKLRFRSPNGVILTLSGAMAVFVPFFISNRGGVALIAGDVAILTLLLKGKLPLARSAFLAAAAVALIVTIAFLRHTTGQLDVLWSFFGQRHFIEPAKTTFIAEAVPDRIPFLLGSSLVSWILTPIPEVVWPDKPPPNELGKLVSSVVYGVQTSDVPPGLIAELYMNFGWLGVLVGSLLMGAALRLAYNSARPWLATPTTALLYTMFLTRFTVFAFNNNVGTGILKLLTEVIPFGVILLIVTSKPPRPRDQLTRSRMPHAAAANVKQFHRDD